MIANLNARLAFLAALTIGTIIVAAPSAQDSVPHAPVEAGPFTPCWTDEQVAALKQQSESRVMAFRAWKSPGLERTEFESILDDMGVARRDEDRRELFTLWDGHRERMITLYSSTARAVWSAAERMAPEWERDRWSKSMVAQSEAQGRRMADAELGSIDDVQQLLQDVVSRLPAELQEKAQFVRARTIDWLLREDELTGAGRAGIARADLLKLVVQAAPNVTDDQRIQIREVLQRYFSATEAARRELVRETNRTTSIAHYRKVNDVQRLAEIRSEISSPKTAQLATHIRDAVMRAASELETVVNPDVAARLRALIDAAASRRPPEDPDSTFPDPQQGELRCQLLAIDPPEIPADKAELFAVIMETSCVDLTRINAELRTIDWDEAMDVATYNVDAIRFKKWQDRRRELLSERSRANKDLGELLPAVLDASALRDLERRLN